ncbi:MAG: glycosyltransferase [Firmicutes bacterium]|nr:glycosyltransferase [Bacillota bacterium]
MKETTYVSVIAYTYNDEEKVKNFLLKLDEFLYQNFTSYEIILVDDSSDDGTFNEIFKTKNMIKGNVSLINMWEKHGVAKSLFAGTDISIGDYIYEIESISIDYPMEILLKMYNKSTGEGNDIVFAKSKSSQNYLRELCSKGLAKVSKGKVSIDSNDLRLISRRALYSITKSKGVITNRNIMFRNCGFSWSELNYSPIITSLNNSKIKNRVKTIEDIFNALIMYTTTLEKIPFIFSGVTLLMSLLLFGLYNIKYISSISHPSSLIISVGLFGLSLILFTLGLIYKKLEVFYNMKNGTEIYKVKNINRINRY